MKLTTEQLDLISKEIIAGGIKYQDLYEELLDHYILAIEDRVEQGQTFGEAFGEVHSEFVNYKLHLGSLSYYDSRKFTTVQKANFGLARLQSEYEEKLNKEITKRHWEIIKSYFRWPTIVTTLLVGLLTFQFAYLVPRTFFIWVISACVFFPLLIVLPQIAKQIWGYGFGKQKFVNSLKCNAIYTRLGFLFALVNIMLNLPRAFFDYNVFKEGPLFIIAFLLCFYIAYSLSFYQLYRERFKVTMA
ncbi:hypothetical protein [Runella salmonicolor]|uniref:DUF1129 domain-containing protein n=1 Tax=Runella salmonicolor TaxID=2950278 RepID=A0ABT1FQP1_9BACT|nr:hypothetical protein [Runella salmonicolor]MCP1384011.1 hypothetical protein [Runella salmonicolor]